MCHLHHKLLSADGTILVEIESVEFGSQLSWALPYVDFHKAKLLEVHLLCWREEREERERIGGKGELEREVWMKGRRVRPTDRQTEGRCRK